MTSHLERLQFSERFNAALSRAGVEKTTPTALTRKFNLLYPDQPVTTQAVRRWLEGTAIPAQDKLVVLASWLKVTPEWLRFGDGPQKIADQVRDAAPPYDLPTLTTLIELLSDEHRRVIAQVASGLLAAEGKSLPTRRSKRSQR